MSLAGLALRRLRSQLWLTLATVVVSAFAAGVLVAAVPYAEGASQAITFEYLQRSNPLQRDISIDLLTPGRVPLARSQRGLRRALRGVPLSALVLQEQTRDTMVTLGRHSQSVAVAYRGGVFHSIRLIAGHLPRAANQALIAESTVAALDAHAGSVLTVGSAASVRLEVAGIYAPARRYALLTARNRLFATPAGYPLLVSATGFDRVRTGVGERNGWSLHWDAVVDYRGATPSTVGRLTRTVPSVATAVNSVPGLGSASTSWPIGTLAPGVNRSVSTGLAAIWVAVAGMTAVGLAVILGVGLLRARRRALESGTLQMRGARPADLAALDGIEAVAIAIVTWPLAVGVGLLVAALGRAARGPGLSGTPFGLPVTTRMVVLAAVCAIVAAAIPLAVSVSSVRFDAAGREPGRSGRRGRSLRRLPWEALLLVAGAVSLYELRRHGAVSTAGRIDPLALAAPAICLAGATALAVRVLALLAGWFEAHAPARGSAAFLAMRRLNHNRTNAAIVLLVAIAAGLFVLSDSLRATVLTRNAAAARQIVGADWNVLTTTPPQPLLAVRTLPPRSTPIFAGTLGRSPLPDLTFANIVALDPTTFAAGAAWVGNDATRPISAVLDRLRSPPAGVALVRGSTLRFTIRSSAPLPGVAVVAVLVTPAGTIEDPRLGTVAGGRRVYRLAVSRPARLLSVMLLAPQTLSPALIRRAAVVIDLRSVAVTGPPGRSELPIQDWQAVGGARRAGPGGPGGVELRLPLVTGGALGGAGPPLPPLTGLTNVLLPSRPIQVVSLGPLTVPVRLVGGLRALPAAPAGPLLAVSLNGLLIRFARVLEAPSGGGFSVLGRGSRVPITPAVRRAGLAPISTLSATTLEARLSAQPQSLALGIEYAAAAVGLGLVILGVCLAFTFTARQREYEQAALRAFGAPDRVSAISTLIEWATLVVVSLGTGLAIGVALLALVAPALADPLTSTRSAASFTIDWAALAIAGAIVGATVAVAGFVAVRAAFARPAAGVLRGEAR